MTLPPAPANGAGNRHMSDGDGVCGGRWNIYNLTVTYNLKMCGGSWNIYNLTVIYNLTMCGGRWNI